MRVKKMLSFTLSFALVLSSFARWNGQRADAAETAKKIVVYVAAEGKSADAEVQVDKTAVQVTEGDKAEVAVQKVLDKHYKGDYDYSNGFLSSIGKLAGSSTAPWVYWGFKVNGAEPQNQETGMGYGIGDYPLQENDQISLVYGTFEDMAKQCSGYDNDAGRMPDEAAQEKSIENAGAQEKLLAEKIYQVNFQSGAYVPGLEDTDSLYSVFSLAQAGFHADAFYDDVCRKVLSQLYGFATQGKFQDTNAGKEVTLSSFEGNKYVLINYTKAALLLSALGVDITDAAGVNLAEKITDRSLYNVANPTTFTRESLMLFVMNAAGVAWPSGNKYITESELVNNLINDVDNQIAASTDLANEWGATLDSAAMSVQALAPYITKNTEGVDASAVEQACAKVVKLLSNMQDNKTGGFVGANNNAWTLAQAMTTVGLLERDTNAAKDADFIKNGLTLFDASARYINVAEGTVDGSLVGGEYAYQPEQLLRGLTSCLRRAEGKSLYDTSAPAYRAKTDFQPPADGEPSPVGPKKVTLKKPVIKKLSSTAKKTLTVRYGKVKNAKKYEIQVATDKKFKKNKKKTTVKSIKAVTFKKLKSKKKYYVRVRAWNGTSKSAYSSVKSLKVR